MEASGPAERVRSDDSARDTTSAAHTVEPAADASVAMDAEPGTRSQRMGIRIGSLGLLFPFDTGREVIEPPAVSRIPNTASWLRGLANVRGTLVPVIDAAAALDLERDAGAGVYLLILGGGDSALGLLIDGLPRLLEVDVSRDVSESSNVPAMLATSVRGAYGQGDRVWLDVDLGALSETLAHHAAPAQGGQQPIGPQRKSIETSGMR